MKPVFVFGTRPESIKIAPCVMELRALGVDPHLLLTGQHDSLLRGTPVESDLKNAENLKLASTGNVTQWLMDAEQALGAWFGQREKGLVVVQGDTMSAYAGALAAKQAGWSVAHIEAGLRTYDLTNPWPEEGFRQAISTMADWHYAPTEHSRANLVKEDIPSDRILVTGNPGVSAMARYSTVQPIRHSSTKVIFLTMHRREWLQSGAFLDRLHQLAQVTPAWDVVWPVHPAVKQAVPQSTWDMMPHNVHLLPPLSYRLTLDWIAMSHGVITDSGGIQEECATLGVPCAVMRAVTDRPESLGSMETQLFGANMTQALAWITETHDRIPRAVFGNPDAAQRIAQHLETLCV